MKYNHIVIEGNIGSGKTTLAKALHQKTGGQLILESFETNPYLASFYKEPDKYSLPLELYFLTERHLQLKSVDAAGQKTVGDYSLDKSKLFAAVNLNEGEQVIFNRVFDLLQPQLTTPDLTVYLHDTLPNLLENIKKRGRSYEQNIAPAYLEKLDQAYLKHFEALTDRRIVLVDSAHLQFMEFPEHLERLITTLETDFPKGITRLRP